MAYCTDLMILKIVMLSSFILVMSSGVVSAWACHVGHEDLTIKALLTPLI